MKEISLLNVESELSECDRIPLHFIGGLQANCGHVLFWQHPSGTIVASDALIHQLPWIRKCQDNERDDSDPAAADDDLEHSRPSLLGDALQEWIPENLFKEIMDIVRDMRTDGSQRVFHFSTLTDHQTFAISLSTTSTDCSLIGMEIEHMAAKNDNAESFLNTLVHLGRILECQVLDVIVNTACDVLFASLGCYDRGMVYRFNDDLSGEVVHEIKHKHIPSSYKGLRFPSSDIPLSARQLYLQNGVRYVHNAEADNVPLLSLSNDPIDLTQCRMRAVATPHIIYMRNLGMVSSLSFAIIVDNELWGLFAYHGYGTPTKPSLHQRIACETITSMVSVRVEAIIKKEQSARIISLGEALMRLNKDQSVIQNLHHWGEAMLETLDADVLVGHVQDPREGEGDTIVLGDASLAPSMEFWTKMTVSHPIHELCVMSTRKEIERKGLTQVDCPASGIVYFRQDRMHIMLGRDVRSKDVKWAGDPEEPKLRIGGILHPRHSFHMFMEKARQESRAWNKDDIKAISVFRERICNHSHKWMMQLMRNDIDDTNRKYLQAIERARDNYEFFAHMSHELRTPFHGVMGCLNIINESAEHLSREEMSTLLNTALTSGQHMINLLGEILNISKNTHLSHTCSNDTVIYQTLAFEAIDGMKTFAMSRQIPLTCEIFPKNDKVVIVTDRTKVIQIVSNTVNNSIKFSGEGGVVVKFSLVDTLQIAMEESEQLSRKFDGVVYIMKENEIFTSVDMVRTHIQRIPHVLNQKWMCIRVADSGCGIAPTKLVHMFQPYTQASAGSNRTFQGTGLGLYICMSLCQQLGGFVVCASTPNVGTVFHIGIPVQLGDDTIPSKPADVDRSSPVTSTNNVIVMRGPIMIVDDNRVNVRILHRALQIGLKSVNIDLEVLTAEGGDAAIALYKDAHPSLCIIDYHMPETDGIASTRAIRAYEKEQGIVASHILCYTADVSDETKKLLLRSGFDNVISKPPYKGFIAELVGRLELYHTKEDISSIEDMADEKDSA